jgi:hypothetical protein
VETLSLSQVVQPLLPIPEGHCSSLLSTVPSCSLPFKRRRASVSHLPFRSQVPWAVERDCEECVVKRPELLRSRANAELWRSGMLFMTAVQLPAPW